MRSKISQITRFSSGAIVFILSIFTVQVSSALISFDEWQHQRVALKDVSMHFRYAGTGPPVLLVHGWPQHSLTWHTIGPILAQKYTVIAVDLRGCGDSSIPRSGNYSAEEVGSDLKGVLDFLNINQTYVFSHDKGVGVAAAFTINNRAMVKRIGFADYPLPGFGIYEAAETPSSSWNLYSNWQLAFFSIPDAAEFFIQGRVREMLAWYFYHSSYSGMEAVSQEHLNRYYTEISKPGFLRSGLSYFAEQYVDATFFTSSLSKEKLNMPILALGGEASQSPLEVLDLSWSGVGTNITKELIPKAGHWIGDENPVYTGERVMRFFDEDDGIPSVNLSYLTNMVSLPQQVAMGGTFGRR